MSAAMATFAGVPASRSWACLALRPGCSALRRRQAGSAHPATACAPRGWRTCLSIGRRRGCRGQGLRSVAPSDPGRNGQDQRRGDRAGAGESGPVRASGTSSGGGRSGPPQEANRPCGQIGEGPGGAPGGRTGGAPQDLAGQGHGDVFDGQPGNPGLQLRELSLDEGQPFRGLAILAFSDWPASPFDAGVQAIMRPVICTRRRSARRVGMAAQLADDDGTRRAEPAGQPFAEAPCSPGAPPGLKRNAGHLAVRADGLPEPACPRADRGDDLIEMPPAAPGAGGERAAKSVGPFPDRFPAGDHAAPGRSRIRSEQSRSCPRSATSAVPSANLWCARTAQASSPRGKRQPFKSGIPDGALIPDAHPTEASRTSWRCPT